MDWYSDSTSAQGGYYLPRPMIGRYHDEEQRAQERRERHNAIERIGIDFRDRMFQLTERLFDDGRCLEPRYIRLRRRNQRRLWTKDGLRGASLEKQQRFHEMAYWELPPLIPIRVGKRTEFIDFTLDIYLNRDGMFCLAETAPPDYPAANRRYPAPYGTRVLDPSIAPAVEQFKIVPVGAVFEVVGGLLGHAERVGLQPGFRLPATWEDVGIDSTNTIAVEYASYTKTMRENCLSNEGDHHTVSNWERAIREHREA